jgi:aspartate aminotransferase
MTGISRRAEQLGTENAFVVLAEVNELIRQGRPVISFCIGQPDFATPQNVREAGIRAIRDGKTGYTPSAGIPELREAVARYVGDMRGITVRPEDVVVGAGAKPFIAYAIMTLTDYGAGHEVIFPVPGFPIYESQIRAQGAVAVPLPLSEAHKYAFDPAELEKKITPRTRLVILNTPHNPCGSILDRSTLKEIAAILARHEHVWVYADEIYSRLVYDGEFCSIASFPGMQQRTIIADGASKTWSMTGWRIGWVATKELAPHMTRWVTNTDSCAGHMNQIGALEAVSGPQDEAERMKAKFHERRDLVVRLLNDVPGFRCLTPGGAFYAWPNVTEACRMLGLTDSEELRRRLLHEADVAVLADQHFGPHDRAADQHIRLSYAAASKAIEEGVGRIAEFVRKNRR